MSVALRPVTAKQSEPGSPADTAAAAAPPSAGRRRAGALRPRNLLIAVIALAALVFGAFEVHERMTHVYEYDARITADLITLSSRVSGWLASVDVREGDPLRAGAVVAVVDGRTAELRRQALEAQMQGIEAERERLRAQRRMIIDQVAARSRTRDSAVDASSAASASLRAELELARAELRRTETLFERRIVADRQVEQARSRLRKLENDLLEAEARIREARGEAEEARVEGARIEVIDSELAMLDSQAARLRAEILQQTIDLEDRTIKSPIDGVVDRVFVETGEYVSAGQRIALVHDPERIWVEANIKETQIRKLLPGQPVRITVDAYPDRDFHGTVEQVGRSTTSNFALLPTPNPSGNFTKITQRIPVRIAVAPTDVPLGPGMMVEVNIDVRDR